MKNDYKIMMEMEFLHMKRRKYSILILTVVVLTGLLAGCSKKDEKISQTEEQTSSVSQNSEPTGIQEFAPIESEDFYIGTWKCLFYYDMNNDEIKSMEDEEGYYMTFTSDQMMISDNGETKTHAVTTSDGIQTNSSGIDYYCLYYDNEVLKTKMTAILMMMKITGASENGVDDGEYLSVMMENDSSKYRVFEKVHD